MRIREDLAKHPLDKTLEAIDRGDQELAKKYAREIWDEGRPLHDLYGDMCALFCTYIADKLGEEAVEDVWRMIGNELWKPVLMQVKENGGTAALVEVYASFLRAHGYKFYAEEDHEKVVFYSRLLWQWRTDDAGRENRRKSSPLRQYGSNEKTVQMVV